MKKLSNTDAELKKSVAYKKKRVLISRLQWDITTAGRAVHKLFLDIWPKLK